MPDQPHPRDLIGGYATSTLSREEREQLLAAALDDQQLFDELVNEEPLRELLNDPLARQKLIDKLSGEQRARDRWFHFGTWRLFISQPKYLAYGGLALLILVGAIFVSLLRLAGPTQESRPEKVGVSPGPPRALATPTPIAGRSDHQTLSAIGPRSDQDQRLSAEQLDLLRKVLVEHEASRERLEALERATAALQLQPDNPELKGILDAALRVARARLSLARAIATDAGELARRSSDYQNAMQKEQDVERLVGSGSTEAAILSAWSAADLFTKASEASTSLFVPVARAAADAAGWVTVAAPADVEVFEADRFIGSNRIMLPAGRHDLDIVNESLGYRERRSVQITAGQVSSVRLNWPNGTLTINAVPWAEAFVDGMRVGETPFAVQVPIGVHEVVLRHPELGERRVTVTVTLGAPGKVSADLRTK